MLLWKNGFHSSKICNKHSTGIRWRGKRRKEINQGLYNQLLTWTISSDTTTNQFGVPLVLNFPQQRRKLLSSVKWSNMSREAKCSNDINMQYSFSLLRVQKYKSNNTLEENFISKCAFQDIITTSWPKLADVAYSYPPNIPFSFLSFGWPREKFCISLLIFSEWLNI